MGTGVLINELRAGGKPGWQARGAGRQDRQDGRDLQAWCDEHLREFCDERGHCNALAVGKAWRFGCDPAQLPAIRDAARDVIKRLGGSE